MFKGRHGLSADAAFKIADALQMSSNERSFFVDLVEARHARNKAEREAAERRLEKREQAPFKVTATEKEMSVIERWYHLAALELVELSGGRIEEHELALRLAISLGEARRAIDVLLRLGLIKKLDGRYVRSQNEFAVTPPAPSRLVRNYHRQFLAVADRAIEEQPMEKRQVSSLLMTFDSKRIDEARKFLTEMEDEFFRRFEAKSGTGDSVYALNHQCFRVDREMS